MLTAVYFISFAPFQLSPGVLLDNFGPGNIAALPLLLAGVGAFLLARAEGIGGLIGNRPFTALRFYSCFEYFGERLHLTPAGGWLQSLMHTHDVYHIFSQHISSDSIAT